ncbi:MAG: LysM peptidoglycan-binding domain-containing protein [Sporichthyaceae bacterium]|nr:LysM peptidoglycan-binding domain-containing protein [Sporichthyaceae bacterium]
MTGTPVRLPSRAAITTRAAGSLLALVALLGGVPVFLTTQIGWPLPRAIPSWEQVQVWLVVDAVDDTTALKVLACVAWIAWAQLSTAVILETVAAARHTTTNPIRLLGPAQLLAASLMGTLLMLAATRNTPVGGPPATRPPLLTEAPAHPTAPAAPPAPRPVPPEALDSPAAALRLPDRAATYTVVAGDTLWDIAHTRLGDPHRWPEIYRANVDRVQPDGRTLRDPDLILPGWQLRLPAPATPEASVPPLRPDREPPTDATDAGTSAPTSPDPRATGTTPATAPTAPHTGPTGPSGGQHARPQPDSGIRLPTGGYAGLTAAAAVAAALTVIQLRRRVHRRLDQPTAPQAAAPGEPARTLRRIWLAAHRRGTADDTQPEPPLPTEPTNGGPVPVWPYPPGVLPVGDYPNGTEHTVDIPASGGLGLTGPGAAGLARYMLTTALGAGTPVQHAHHTTVHISRADLTELLGVDPPPEPPPRLRIADTLDRGPGPRRGRPAHPRPTPRRLPTTQRGTVAPRPPRRRSTGPGAAHLPARACRQPGPSHPRSRRQSRHRRNPPRHLATRNHLAPACPRIRKRTRRRRPAPEPAPLHAVLRRNQRPTADLARQRCRHQPTSRE